jgi:hypothetical protein
MLRGAFTTRVKVGRDIHVIIKPNRFWTGITGQTEATMSRSGAFDDGNSKPLSRVSEERFLILLSLLQHNSACYITSLPLQYLPLHCCTSF